MVDAAGAMRDAQAMPRRTMFDKVDDLGQRCREQHETLQSLERELMLTRSELERVKAVVNTLFTEVGLDQPFDAGVEVGGIEVTSTDGRVARYPR